MTATARLALLISVPASSAAAEPTPARDEVVRYAVESGERTWRKTAGPPADLSSRELFMYALALIEDGAHAELHDRLARLLELAERMQDRNPKSRGYGNFRWRWSEGSVQDWNAVEFCMQSGAIIWLRHRDSLRPETRARLRELLEFSVEGCLRHRVRESYTNIALMNAENLILLGEALARPDVADEGYRRLDRFVLYTWESGIHEYGSPTYYGVDLECLGLVEAFCRRESGREAARALLELFWTDIAANWFAPAGKLAGAHSRDYDYLRGLGMLDTSMWSAGRLQGRMRGGTSAVLHALARWRPSDSPGARLRDESAARFPRLVRQSWGGAREHSRTHYLLPDVTLGSAGANYGAMDLPLTVDFAGPRESVRCYFIPDARRDPYGKKKVPAGPHRKTLHLKPFWAASQRKADALGLVVYRERDLPETVPTLESHFVMPRGADDLWVGDTRVALLPGETKVVELAAGDAVVVRKGTAAAGVRVPWARSLDGTRAPAALVDDGNAHGAVRLTVAHHGVWGVGSAGRAGGKSARPGAAFWVRVGSGLDTDAAFDEWRRRFAASRARVEAPAGRVLVRAEGEEGAVAVGAEAPFSRPFELEPASSRLRGDVAAASAAQARAVLELDGEDVGRRILAGLPVVEAYLAEVAKAEANAVRVDGPAYWEAESGLVREPMAVARDGAASGGEYVWMPGEPGGRGGSAAGSVTWKLDVSRAGDYHLWGRVTAPTPDDDSFYVDVSARGREGAGEAGGEADIVRNADWHTGVHGTWEWTRVTYGRSAPAGSEAGPQALTLLRGGVTIRLRVRENGTKIDRLYVSPNARDEPE